MKRGILILILAGLFTGLAACMPDFEKGDMVEARVGRIGGDPCRLLITLMGAAGRASVGMTARLESNECKDAPHTY